MRYAYLALAGLFISLSVAAAEIDDVEGLREAINTHNSALLSGDRTQVAKTVVFPHVQFYPDGRVVVTQEESELPNQGEDQTQWRITDTSLVTHENNMAIVRVSFELAADGSDIGAGLWCYTLRDGAWLIYWRHYLGQDANQ